MGATAEVDGQKLKWDGEKWVEREGAPVGISLELSEIREAFTEWDRRYREEPETFMSEVRHLLEETPESYGVACEAYFVDLVLALRSVKTLGKKGTEK